MKSPAFASALWLLASSAFGAEDAPPEQASPALAWFTLLLPTLGLVLLFFLLFRNRRATAGYLDRAKQHADRDTEHMALMEAKADRMIALLESIDRRLGGGA